MPYAIFILGDSWLPENNESKGETDARTVDRLWLTEFWKCDSYSEVRYLTLYFLPLMSLNCFFNVECYIFDSVNVIRIVELDTCLIYFEIEGTKEESSIIANFCVLC